MNYLKKRWLIGLSLAAFALAACGDTEVDPDGDLLPKNDGGVSEQDLDGLVINEITSKGDDLIELYNGGSEAIDLAGFYVTDEKLDIPTAYVFPAGASIGAGDYLVLKKGTHHEFGLGNADAVVLFTPDHEIVDQTEWADGEAQISWCRLPNGAGAFQTCNMQTFGRENSDAPAVCGNGLVEKPEEICDGEELDGASCEDFGFTGGTIACAPGCDALDTSACTGRKSAVVINEVTSQDDDNIELFNTGDAAVDLSGWIVSDDKGLERVGDDAYVFPEGTVLQPGEYLVLENPTHHTFGIGGEDEVNLYDADQNLIDKADWPSGGALVSFCRIPNGTGDFRSCSERSFGAENVHADPICGDAIKNADEECDGLDLGGMSCAALGFAEGELACASSCVFDTSACVEVDEDTPRVVINEVTSKGDDSIELYNPGAVAIDLSGWIVSDDEGLARVGVDAYVFPEGTLLQPGEYLVLIEHTFGLGGNDAVNLYDPDQSLIDVADWPADGAAVSYCRIPNGTGDFQSCSEQTFGFANVHADAFCGDEIKNADEECDGLDLGGMSCPALGFAEGELACASSCTFDTSACVEVDEDTPRVVINEVTSKGDDNIELYNPGTVAIDLSGWIVSDDEGLARVGVDAYVFPEGTLLQPGEYLVIIEHTFGLGGNDAVNLYDTEQNLIDVADWPADGAIVSYCRIPNGTGDFQSCSEQSFGFANVE